MPTRQEALEQFVYEVNHDFQGPDNETPSWAAEYPKQWGDETDRIDLRLHTSRSSSQDSIFRRHNSAISADEKIFAAIDGKAILVFDIQTKELQQRIREGEHPIKDLWFAHSREIPNYLLVSSRETERGFDGSVELYQLDQYGRLLNEAVILDTHALASKAFGSIQQDLTEKYGWTDDSIASLGIANGFEKILNTAEKRRATKGKAVILGSVAGFGSKPFDSSGRFMLYRRNNATTQNRMRPPEQLPQVVVYDLVEKREILTLSGHTDAIMWAGYSPDNTRIASVSWDGSMRVYAASTGELEWKTDSGGGQAWCASFSHDSKYIVASTGKGRVITVHESKDGNIVAKLEGLEVNDWVRNLVWRPADDYSIAFSYRKSVYIWQPFGEASSQLKQEFRISNETDGGFRGFVSLHVDWLDDGRKVIVASSDGTLEIWDTGTNRKWRMLKPKGKVVEAALGRRHLISSGDGERRLVSMDGDGVVRIWTL